MIKTTELQIREQLGLTQQLRGMGGNRPKKWPFWLYCFCAAKNFDINKAGHYGIQCSYSGAWLRTARYIDLGLRGKGYRAEITANLDHADPLSFSFDNTFLNLMFLSKFINGSNFKHDKIAAFTVFVRARYGATNNWPHLARLISETWEFERFPLVGWPINLSDAEGRPIFPGYDMETGTFNTEQSIIDEYRRYRPRVRAFCETTTNPKARAAVERIWNKHFKSTLPL